MQDYQTPVRLHNCCHSFLFRGVICTQRVSSVEQEPFIVRFVWRSCCLLSSITCLLRVFRFVLWYPCNTYIRFVLFVSVWFRAIFTLFVFIYPYWWPTQLPYKIMLLLLSSSTTGVIDKTGTVYLFRDTCTTSFPVCNVVYVVQSVIFWAMSYRPLFVLFCTCSFGNCITSIFPSLYYFWLSPLALI